MTSTSARPARRIAIVGATGNVGLPLMRALASDPSVERLVGIARRRPSTTPDIPNAEWIAADTARTDLHAAFEGMDAVVHLAWAIQPSHDDAALFRTNVEGSMHIVDAAQAAGVDTLVYASSIGTYAPGPSDVRVDESWPHTGISSSFYARHKATVEGILDRVEAERSSMRIVRFRPSLILRHRQGSEVVRNFLGPLIPPVLLEPRWIKLLPIVPGLSFQVVHTDDVVQAMVAALRSDVRGAFNLAAEPIIGLDALAEVLGARGVTVPGPIVRAAVDLSWRARLQPTPPGWIDMALSVPKLSTDRARAELGWTPVHSSYDALLAVLKGVGEGAGEPTAPLEPTDDTVARSA